MSRLLLPPQLEYLDRQSSKATLHLKLGRQDMRFLLAMVKFSLTCLTSVCYIDHASKEGRTDYGYTEHG